MSNVNNTLLTKALPVTIGLLATVGLAGGTFCLISPLEATFGFGAIPSSSSTLDQKPILSPFSKVYVRTHSLRNISSGLSLFSMLYFWQFSDTCRTNLLAADIVKKCIGICLTIGSAVAFGDGLIIREYVKEGKAGGDRAEGLWEKRGETVSKEAVELGEKKSLGHCITAIPILILGLACLLT